jgi:hypothetical protein
VLEKYLQTEKKIFRACHGIVQTSKNSSDPLLIIRLNYKQLTHTHTHTLHTHYTHTLHTLHTHTFQKAQDPPLDVLTHTHTHTLHTLHTHTTHTHTHYTPTLHTHTTHTTHTLHTHPTPTHTTHTLHTHTHYTHTHTHTSHTHTHDTRHTHYTHTHTHTYTHTLSNEDMNNCFLPQFTRAQYTGVSDASSIVYEQCHNLLFVFESIEK